MSAASQSINDLQRKKFNPIDGVPLDVPGESAYAVTPSNSVDLAFPTRGIYVGATGDVRVNMVTTGTAIDFLSLAAGVLHPLRVSRIYASGTTATGIVAVY